MNYDEREVEFIFYRNTETQNTEVFSIKKTVDLCLCVSKQKIIF